MKAGRTISGPNMGHVHQILDAATALHDNGQCTDDDCPYGDGADEPPEAADKAARRRAMGEGSGSDGGVTVNEETGTHGAPDTAITHSHGHDGNGVNEGDDGLHTHEHDHAAGEADHGHSHADMSEADFKVHLNAEHKAPMSQADQNDLPDSAFAVILPGGKKDAEGKTVPRSLRLLPHHKADGSLDLSHLKALVEDKNALARVSQIDASADVKAKAEAHLEKHATDESIGDRGDNAPSKVFSLKAFEDALSEAFEAVEEDF